MNLCVSEIRHLTRDQPVYKQQLTVSYYLIYCV